MARLYVKQNSIWPFHITGRSPNREQFRTSLGTTWSIMEDYLYYSNKKYNLKIHSFVLMPNHFHLLASCLDISIGVVMCDLMAKVSKEINFMTGRINQNWGSRHFKCELNKEHYFYNTYKYVYQNPLRARLVNKVEEWPCSTLSGKLGLSKLIIPATEDTLLFSPNLNENTLAWLNRLATKEQNDWIRKALTKKTFTLPKVGDKRVNPIEETLI